MASTNERHDGEAAMSTDDFLAGLELHQLRYAREAVDARIKEKEREQKLIVWSVDDRDVVLEYFGSDEYMKAVEYLVGVARERFSAGSARRSSLQLQIRAQFVLESEYDSFGVPRPG